MKRGLHAFLRMIQCDSVLVYDEAKNRYEMIADRKV